VLRRRFGDPPDPPLPRTRLEPLSSAPAAPLGRPPALAAAVVGSRRGGCCINTGAGKFAESEEPIDFTVVLSEVVGEALAGEDPPLGGAIQQLFRHYPLVTYDGTVQVPRAVRHGGG
jgi:hypothetical protein